MTAPLTQPTREWNEPAVRALIVTAKAKLRTAPLSQRVRIRAAIADLEATFDPGPVEAAILHARTDADLLAVIR